jgi:hypothetical protein
MYDLFYEYTSSDLHVRFDMSRVIPYLRVQAPPRPSLSRRAETGTSPTTSEVAIDRRFRGQASHHPIECLVHGLETRER